jgi:hypothetical protein
MKECYSCGQPNCYVPPKDLGLKIDPEKKEDWSKAFQDGLAQEEALADGDSLDREVEAITRAMDTSVEETMACRKPYGIGAHPYWSPRCQEVKELQMLAPPQDYHRLHLQLCRVVRSEKAKFCMALTELANKDNIYRFAVWSSGRQRKGLGPVRAADGNLVTEDAGKAQAFFEVFFPKLV